VPFAFSGDWGARRARESSPQQCSTDSTVGSRELLKGESRFGAELDSLSDVIAFGVSPAVHHLFLGRSRIWSRRGWLFALAHAVCCAFRLARFNSNLDVEWQPQKSAGFSPPACRRRRRRRCCCCRSNLWIWIQEPAVRGNHAPAPCARAMGGFCR